MWCNGWCGCLSCGRMVGVVVSNVVDMVGSGCSLLDHWWYNGWRAHLQCGRSLVV